ncbi:hypothetical protein JYU34_006551 [Plutella xylostella]|uniref:Peptidase S1 domain-containing protein n=1 Tax=Plutella xylostella TaxID=51655 RepID=A0ABQ7QS86_PLUXY|nr:hypothetical protein JYU34_006551 [Plutella xylostella]
MRFYVIISLLGVAFASPNSRIMGGADTAIEDYPFFASIEYNTYDVWFLHCGGALISNDAILSAASCFVASDPAFHRARLGSSNATTGGTLETIGQFILHPNFNRVTMENDIALLRLQLNVEESQTIQYASIPGPNYVLADNFALTAIGVGRRAPGDIRPAKLQSVRLNLINRELCAARYAVLQAEPGYENWPTVTNTMVCTAVLDQPGIGTCQGDNGGPITAQGNVVYGVASWQYSCGSDIFPSVNTWVSPFSNWIQANV